MSSLQEWSSLVCVLLQTDHHFLVPPLYILFSRPFWLMFTLTFTLIGYPVIASDVIDRTFMIPQYTPYIFL